MPLHGKIVVVKRSGGDGTEFPLTASCLFGRKPDCDIRIQLPQVSKEHCRIDLNENKEVILTNLSTVNPTRVNGEALQQSERLKHGDVITIIDRSFRFEYPPAPTPKKRPSLGSKTETFKVLQDPQVDGTETGEKRISEVSTDPHLKDGTNHENIQRSLEKTLDVESKEDDSLLQSKTTSPFNDLYQMIKKSLDVKTPRKSSASLLQTPTSRFCTPKPVSVRKNVGNPVISSEDKITPKKDEADISSGADETKREAENISNGTPKSVRKQRKSFQVTATELARPEAENAAMSEAALPQKRNRVSPQRFTVGEVIEQVSAHTSKSPVRRRSKETTPTKPAVTSPKTAHVTKASPRNSGKVEKVKELPKKRRSGELDLPTPQMKRKRVSFGGHLSPELFDKRLPPDSPLRKGATPRRSLCLFKPKQSLLRRASVIGLQQEFVQEHPDSPNVRSPAKMSAKNASPKTPAPGKKSPKSKSPSPKAATPGKKSPKSNMASPKAATPGKKSPKSNTASPKAATPGKKSPKSNTASPKAATPGKKSPKSNTASPKAVTPATKSPKSRTPSPKAASPRTKSSESKSPHPARGRSPSRNKAETPGVQTPTVQGRFSVSRISTPSPLAEHTVADQVPLVTVTPKIPLRRMSMKRTSQKTPSVVKSAVKVMCRKSGISRASMKASWANIVKFGQTKAQVAAPAKKIVTKKPVKKAVTKPQTPAGKLKGHASTGHADSPVTIVVGRAHKQRIVHPTGAAPRLVTNIALLKKNMKMDEDLTGIPEMFKTPANERKRRSFIDDSAMKTPMGGLGASMVEPSVLNTPEEPGEMIVSPLSVSSTVKDRQYNSEAVQRLLNGDQESSFVTDIPAMETHSDDSIEQQSSDLKTTTVTTPKHKPEPQECFTGVKRIMKTPKQKAEPVEDLRGRLLKTPKQKPEQQECLSGVKRIMKTPRQKAEPVEDLRGKILKTPKQKPEQQECFTGVKRIFQTPQQEAEPVDDIRGKSLETPKALEAGDVTLDGVKEIVETPAHEQESEDQSEMTNVTSSPSECFTGINRLMKTPREKSAPVEDMVGVKRLLKTPREKIEPVEENFGIKRLLKTPRLRGNAPVEDFEGLQELMEEPLTEPTGQLETNEVEDQTSPECGVDVAKELDFAHEEPQDDVPSDVIDHVPQAEVEKEADANEVVVDDHLEELPSGHNDDESSDAISQAAVDENLPVEEPKMNTAVENVSEEQPKMDTADESVSEEQPKMDTADESMSEEQPKVDTVDESVPEEQPKVDTVDESVSEEQPKVDTVDESVSEEQPKVDTVDESVSEEQPKVDTVDESVSEEQPKVDTADESVSEEPTEMHTAEENVSEEQPKVETPTDKVSEVGTPATDPDHEKKPVRGRRAKTVEIKSAEDKQETSDYSEEPVVSAPVRGGRRKKTEATAPPAVRQTTRNRSKDVELTMEKSASQPSKAAIKPKRGRNAKKASDDQAEIVQEVVAEKVPEPESEQSPPVDVDHKANDSAAPPEKAALKPKRGRKMKQPEQSVPEQQDALCCTHSDDDPQADTAKDANEVCSDQLEVVLIGNDENTSSDAMETVPQAPATEVETETCNVPETNAVIVQKKSVRGRRAKVVESKSAEDKQEVTECSEDPVVPAPVRGRRGKKAEATAPPAVRQTARSRNAKSQEGTSEAQPEMELEKAVETTLVTEISTEAVSDQTSEIITHQEENDAAPAKEVVVKPTRGRKNKQIPVEPEPETNEVLSEDHLVEEVQPQKSVHTLEKPRRGRKTKPDPVEEKEVATVVPVETKQQSQPPIRAKRGRNAKLDEEKPENDDKATSVETTKSQQAVKKLRRTRKAEQDQVEPIEEVQAVEMVVAEEAKAPLVAESLKMTEEATVAAKPRRGGRKAKQDTESEAPVESTEVQEVPVVSSTDKPKRGRRGKQVAEEVEVTAVVPEEKPELEAEEKNNTEPDAPVVKPSRTRGVKTEASQVIPAKRARRGAALPLEETNAESTDLVSESAPVQPAKRGRRAAVKPIADEATATSDQANPTEDLTNAVVEDAKMSKRSVRWKTDMDVFEIPKATPVKAVRGRKSKLGDQVDTESKTEEKDLSDKVVEVQPAKRARRGAKVTTVTAEEEESTSKVPSVKAEAQPKTRRGRSAKK